MKVFFKLHFDFWKWIPISILVIKGSFTFFSSSYILAWYFAEEKPHTQLGGGWLWCLSSRSSWCHHVQRIRKFGGKNVPTSRGHSQNFHFLGVCILQCFITRRTIYTSETCSMQLVKSFKFIYCMEYVAYIQKYMIHYAHMFIHGCLCTYHICLRTFMYAGKFMYVAHASLFMLRNRLVCI